MKAPLILSLMIITISLGAWSPKDKEVKRLLGQVRLQNKRQRLQNKRLMEQEKLQKENDDKFKELSENAAPQADQPYLYTCGYKNEMIYDDISSDITFDSLSTNYTNIVSPGSGLDISTGVFTSPTAGIFTVTYSVYREPAWVFGEETMYIRRNDVQIPESTSESWFFVESGGSAFGYDNIGRTIIISLEKGDLLDLYCDGCEDVAVHKLNFCISLNQQMETDMDEEVKDMK